MSRKTAQANRKDGFVSKRLLCGTSLSALMLLVLPSVAHAQNADRNWDANGSTPGNGGTGTWNTTGGNWAPDASGQNGPYVPPWDNALLDNAIFGGTAGTVTLGVPITVHNIIFNTSGYTLTGNTLTLAGTTPTITVNSGSSTIASAIAGSAGLTKEGVGGLTLSGANTLSGDITINAGTLSLSGTSSFTGDIYVNSTARGGLTIVSDAALGAASNRIFTAAGSWLTILPTLSASRVVTLGSGGTVVEGAGAGAVRYTGAGDLTAYRSGLTNNFNDYTGQTTFSFDGFATFSSVGNLGEASALGAPVTVAKGTIIVAPGGGSTRQMIYIGDGDDSNRNWDMRATGANLTFSNSGTGTLTLRGDILLSGTAGTGVGYAATTGDIDLLGQMSGPGTFASVSFSGGAGRTITLGGSNSFNASAAVDTITVKASVLANIGASSSLGAGTNVGVNNGGVLSYTGAGASSNRIWSVSGAGTISNDSVAGALNLSGALGFVAGGAVDTLTLGGSYAGGVNTFSGLISGAGGLASSGSGIWELTAANTRTGTIAVNSGTLRAGNAGAFGTVTGTTVNGGTLDLNGTSLVTPTLGGTGGTIALGTGDLTVNGTAASSYGGSITGSGPVGLIKTGIGVLTLTGQNTFTGATNVGGGTLRLDFSGAPTSDILSASSVLNLSGGSTLSLVGAAEANSQSFAGVNILSGSNTIRLDEGAGGSLTLNLGALSRTAGTVNFIPEDGLITTANADGALGGWALINNTDYAKVVGGTIVAFDDTDYTGRDDAGTWQVGEIITDEDTLNTTSFFGTVASSVQLGGLRFVEADPTTTITIAGGQTLGVDGAIIVAPSVGNNSQLITGGSITGSAGGGTLAIQQSSGGNFQIASQIIDNGGATGFLKGGTGLVTLTGSNNYSGATTISQGVLSVSTIGSGGAASNIGASGANASNLIIDSSELRYTGATSTTDRGFTVARTLGNDPTINVTTAGSNLTFSGQVVGSDSAGLTKTGVGTLTLANSTNSYAGVTKISAGTLAISTIGNGGGPSSLGASSNASANLVIETGGTLQYTGTTAATDRGMTLNGAPGGVIDVTNAGTTLAFGGVVASIGPAPLRKEGAGTLVLSGTNTYSGTTTVNGGTLRAGSTQAFGGPNLVTLANTAGVTLDLAGFNNKVGGLAGGGASGGNVALGGATLTIGGTNASFSGSISGSGRLIKDNTSTQTFVGCNNTYLGSTTIQGSGVLNVDCLANGGSASGIGASGSASSNLIFINGALNYTGATVSTNRGFTVQGSTQAAIGVENAATILTFSGQVTGANGIVRKDGAGTLVLSGTNNYGGGTIITAGTLRAGSTTAFGTGGMTVNAGTTLDLNSLSNSVLGITGNGNVTLGSATLTLTDGGGLTFSGAISGTGGLVKNGAGTQILAGCNSSYGGPTTINGGILSVNCLANGGSNSAIGASGPAAGNLILNGGTLQYTGGVTSTDRRFTLGPSSSSKIEASGTGALALTNTNAIAFSSPGTAQTIKLGGTNTGNNSLAAQISNNAAGTTSFTKEDSGTWILTNQTSSYTGVTSIVGGVLGVSKLSDGDSASSIGASASDASFLVIGSGTTLRYTGAGDSTNRLFTLAAGSTFLESAGTGAIAFTNTGAIGFTGTGVRNFALGGTNTGANIMGASIANGAGGVTTLAKSDSGTWYLTGTNTYTGNTNINAGTLYIGNGGTTGSIASANINNFGALGFNRSDAATYAGTISGTGSVLQAGTGTTILTGTNIYTGGTTVSAGTLQLGSGGATGSIVGNVTNNGTLAFNRNNAYTFGGTITGTGTIAQIGTGTTTLTAANAAGATTISAGTLNVNGALTTQTVAMTGTSTLNVNATMGAAAGGTATFTGDAGASTINVASGVILRATGDLGGGSDVVNVTGTLNTGPGTLSLGDGNDTLALNGLWAFSGKVDGGPGADALQVSVSGFRVLDGASVTGFETLEKTLSGLLILTGDHSYTNGVTNAAGSLQIGDGSATGTLVGDVANSGTLTFNRAGTSTYAGVISGTGAVNHNGSGTTNFTGNNSYTGATNLTAGTLLVNGDQTGATGLTTVTSGATLGGTGVIGGNVTVANGTLAAGSNGAGTLTINGNLALGSSSQLAFEFGQANMPGGPLNDLVNVGGNLTLDGRVNVTQPSGGSFGPGVYRMFNYAGTLTDNGLAVGSLPSGTAFVQTAVANQVNLVNTAGLNLNFWDGAAGPKNDNLIQGGSGTWLLSGGQNNWTDVNGLVNADYAQNSFAIFQGTGGTVTVDNSGGNVLASGMQFTIDGYTIAGGPLTLTGTDALIRIGDGGAGDAGLTTTIGAALTGSAQLVKDLGGTLILAGTNTYTGGTAINGGTLRISSDANLGDATGALSLDGGTLNATASFSSSRAVNLAGAGTFFTDAGVQLNLDGLVAGAGTLVKDGDGTVILTANNSYTGGTTINAGSLQIGNAGMTGSVVGDIVNNAELRLARSDTYTIAGLISGTGAVRKAGGTTILTADNSYTGGTTNSSGIFQLGAGGTTGGIVGDIINQGTFVFNRSNEYTFAGAISGSGDVEQAGTGTTILTAANSYAGTTTVTAGTLLINGDQSAATGVTSVNTGGTLGGIGIIGGDVTVANGATLAPGDATGPGTLAVNGNLTLSGTSRLDYQFGQSNTVGGPLNDLTQVGGNLTLAGTIDVTVTPGGSFGPGLYRVISYGGTLTDNGLALGTLPPGSLVSVQTSVAGQVNLINATGATLNFWDGAVGPKADGAINGGTGVWQNSTGNDNWTNPTGVVNGAYSDSSFAIFAAAPGTVSVDNGLGAVTASGMQFASDGYIVDGQALTLTDPQSVVRVGDGTVVGLGFTATIAAEVTGSAQLVKTDLGTLVLTGANSYTGGTQIDAGTLRISNDTSLGDAAGALTFNGGKLNTTANLASARLVDLAGTGTFLTDGGTTLTLNGAVSGAGGLTKDGAGSLILTGANAYSGDTVVTAGSLFVNGDQSAVLGLTSVATGATLGGSGTIGGNVTLADGATLAAGTNNVGTLTVGGNLALSAGSVLDFEFGQANLAGGALNDLVNVGGDLTLDGTINVAIPAGGSFGPGIYRAFNYGGALTDNGLTLGALPGGSVVSVQTAIAGQVNLVNTAGLTLSFWDGAAGPKNDNIVEGGNGVWRVGGGSNNWTDLNGTLNADYTQGSFAIFSAAPGTVTVDNAGGNVLATGLQFASDGYTITGGPLTLTGAQAIVQVGDGSGASAGYTAMIDAVLTGTAGLVKTDAGTLVLAGTNSYTGGTAINGGTIRISQNANLGDNGGVLSFDGGTLNTTATMAMVRNVDLVGTGTLDVDGGTMLVLNGGISGGGALVKTGTGILTLDADNSYTGGTTVSGGTLLIGRGGTTGSISGDVLNNAVLQFARSDDVVFGGTISGSGSFSQTGPGVLTLTAGNSYTGTTSITGFTPGTLQLGNGGTTGSVAGNVVNSGTLIFNRSNQFVFAGLITGAGNVEQAGNGTTVLTAANGYAGTTRVSAGTLLINGDQSAATGLTAVAASATLGGTGTIGGDVLLGDGTLASGAGGAGTLTINGNLSMTAGAHLAYDFGAANAVGNPLNDLVNVGGNLTLDGTLDVAVTPGGSFDIGLYRIADYGGTLTDNGLAIGTVPAGADVFVQTSVTNQVNLINKGGATLNFWDGAAGPKFNGAVNGGDGIWQNGTGNDNWADATGAVNAGYADGAFAIFTGTAGTVTVDNSLGAVTASGLQFATDGYTIAGGDLTLTGPQAVVRVGDGTAGGAAYTATIGAGLTGSAQLVKTDLGTLVLTGTNSYTGGTAINGGTLRIASDANLGDAAGELSFNGGTLNTMADLSSTRAVGLAGAGRFLTDAGTNLTLAGPVSGAGSLTKSGAGTLVLSGTGTYAGTTTVGAGTLLVNGNYSGAIGATAIASGASLGGTGTIGGDVALADGAILTPGAVGAGTLTINGDLLLSQTATLAYEFGQAGVAGGALNDLVNVGGDLTLDGTLNVTVPTGGAFDVGVYRVFNYGGALTDNGLTLGALPGGASATVQTSIAGQINLVNSAGLTLNFWDGAAGPKNNGVINGGTGIWQNSTGNDNWTNAGGTVNAAYGDGAFAVFGGTGGTVTVDNGLGQVSASGMQFAANGYTIAGNGIALTGPQSTVRVGDGSTAGAGFTATINSTLSGDTQLVKADAGTLVLGGTNSYTGGTVINGGTVQIAADTNLGAAAGTVTLNGGTLATSATLTSARDFALTGAGTISTASGTTFTFDGKLSGTGALTKAGAGTLILTGDNSAFAGSTQVQGTLAVNGSLCGDVNVLGGARLQGTGTVCTTVNAGTVAPGNSIGTLTVAGNYTGSGGTLEIEAVLGGDASPADRLVVTGSTAGTTQVNVINVGGTGAATVEGIRIVDVGGASNGVFTLNGDYVFQGDQAVIAGAYGYRLYKNGVATPTDGDWYLRSSLLDAPNPPGTPNVPLYQPGVPVYEGYGQTLLALNELGTLQERVGNRQWAQTESGKPSGIWGRMQSGRSRPNAVRSTSLADVNVDSWKFELGADHVLSERGDGATLVLGVLGGYGEASASIASPFGNGSIKTKGYSAGATLSWFGPQGFYIDSRAQVTWFDSKLKSAVLGTLAEGNSATGQAYSVEIGKRSPLGGKVSVTPQIQMVYSTVGFDAFTDPNGAVVSSRLGDSLKTRWGLSIDRQDAKSHLYGVANLSYEWLDGTATDVSGTPIARENHRLWGELGVGGSMLLGDRLTLYTEASANTAVNDFGKSYSLKGVAGLRLAF